MESKIELNDDEYDLLMQKARSYEDIEDLSDFKRSVEFEYLPSDRNSSTETTTSFEENDSFSMKAFREGKRELSNHDIRGQRKRPGSLGQQKTKRDPNLQVIGGEKKVSNPDNIPVETYRKMARDPIFSLGIHILKGWIGSLKFSVESENQLMRETVRHVLEDNWSSLMRGVMANAAVEGFTVAEKKWVRDEVIIDAQEGGEIKDIYEGKILKIDDIKFPDTTSLKYYVDDNEEIVRIEQNQSAKRVSVKREKLIWFAMDRETDGLFGRSRFKAGYPYWYYSKQNEQQSINHIDRLGSPHIEGRFPKGFSYDEDGNRVRNEKLLFEYLKMLRDDGVAVMPSDRDENGELKWDVGYDETAEGSVEDYLDWQRQLDRNKFYSMGFPPMIDEEGNFSFADAMMDIFIVVLEDIVNQLETTMQKDVVDQIVSYNFGPKFTSKVRLKIDRSALNRRRIFKEIVNNVIRSSFSVDGATPNVLPDIGEMMRDMGIPVTGYDQLFSEGNLETDGESPAKEAERDRASNDEQRVKDRETDDERPTSEDDATDD